MALSAEEEAKLIAELGGVSSSSKPKAKTDKPTPTKEDAQLVADLGGVGDGYAPPQESSSSVPDWAKNAQSEMDAQTQAGGKPYYDQTLVTPEGAMGAVTRGLTGGALSTVTVPLDFIAVLMDSLKNGVTFDGTGRKTVTPSDEVQNALTYLGVPQPKTGIEKAIQAGASGYGGAKSVVGAGQSLAEQLPIQTSNLGRFGQQLAENATGQAIGGTVGGVTGEVARQGAESVGAPEWAQTIASLMGNVVGGTAGMGPKTGTVKPGEPYPGVGTPLPKEAPPMSDAQASKQVGDLIRKAKAGGGAARIQLAELASYDQEAMKAANDLGLDLPADIFSNSPQLRAAAGLSRSLASGEAEATWKGTTRAAADKADELFKKFGATYVDTTPSSSTVGEQIKQSMTSVRNELKGQYAPLYKEVEDSVPRGAKVTPSATTEYLDQLATELGGPENFNDPSLARLYKTMKSSEPTYALFMQEKQGLFDAINKKNTLWPDAGERIKSQLYDAMAKDQLEVVGKIASPEVAEKLNAANLLYAQKKGIDERARFLYGKEESKDLEKALNASIMSEAGSKSSGQFVDIIAKIPEEYRKDAIATSLAAITRGKQGGEKGFGFTQFADAYEGLRAHPKTYAEIEKAMGPDAMEMYRNLYLVSKKVAQANANVIMTGKANQVLSNAMQADGLLTKVLDSKLGNAAVVTAASALNPFAAGVMSSVARSMAEGGRGSLQAASRLFASDKFQGLLAEVAARGEAGKSSIEAVASSPEFARYSKTVGIKPADRFQWIYSALLSPKPKETKPTDEPKKQRGAFPFPVGAN